MSLGQTLQVLLVVALMVVGQILFKLAAGRISGSGVSLLWSLALDPFLIAGLATYALTTVLWVLVLREVPLSRAYPLMALATLGVPIIGFLAFREPFSWSLGVGGVLMAAGALMVTLR
jgi:drug/metabolite transporter (DMT)-like permease